LIVVGFVLYLLFGLKTSCMNLDGVVRANMGRDLPLLYFEDGFGGL